MKLILIGALCLLSVHAKKMLGPNNEVINKKAVYGSNTGSSSLVPKIFKTQKKNVYYDTTTAK